ncbi:MAG: keto-deoxy-phosphogluconate aldolase, partial [Methylotenera sp.]|nr:keto-deoxy-phosphogluconate aldolase [Methylotenera sp.]
MLDTLSLASHGPVIPVIVIQRLEDAVPLAEALVSGGIKVLEVTLRTPVALQAMEAMAKVPGAIVGAGTLRRPQDVANDRNAGCVFGVSPGYTDALA